MEQHIINPISYESNPKNRFIVECKLFPAYMVKSISNIKYDFSTKRWQYIEFELYQSAEYAEIELFNLIKNFKELNLQIKSLNIKCLDPTGEQIYKWDIEVENIISIDFGSYDYSKDDINTTKVVIAPLNCSLTY